MPDFIGFLHLFSCLGPWMASMFLPFVVLALCLLQCSLGFALVAVYVIYFVYRRFVPRGTWHQAWDFMSKTSGTHHYFANQQTVLEEGMTADDLKPNSKKLFCFHPHGIMCIGWSLNGCMAPVLHKSDISFMVAENLMGLAFISDILSWYGCSAASKENICKRMKTSQNLALLPGGFQEATLFQYGHHRVYIKHRAGFIKYALQHGYKLYPAYTFGEEHTYHAASGCLPFRLRLNDYHIPTVMYCGKWYLPFMPHNNTPNLVTVIGNGFQLPLIESPTNEQVNLWHEKYMQELSMLFYRHAEKYAHKDAVLELY